MFFGTDRAETVGEFDCILFMEIFVNGEPVLFPVRVSSLEADIFTEAADGKKSFQCIDVFGGLPEQKDFSDKQKGQQAENQGDQQINETATDKRVLFGSLLHGRYGPVQPCQEFFIIV